MTYDDDFLRGILYRVRRIACVGVSPNPVRPSYFVARYLGLKGFRVIPVNPGLAGQRLFGEAVFADLADIPASVPVDMVDIFRRSEFVPPIVKAAIEHLPKLRTVWSQIGVPNADRAARAIVRAGWGRKRQVGLTWYGRTGAWFGRHLPGVTHLVIARFAARRR